MDYRWDSLGETGAGQDAERRLAESIRVKASEFEREREAYIEAAKQLLLQDLSKTGVGRREDGRGVRSRLAGRGQEEDKENVGEINGNIVHRNPPSPAPAAANAKSEMEMEAAAAAAAAAAAVAGVGAGAGPRQHGGKVRAAPSLRQAREERRAASEEIRVLQQRKADAAVRLQGERLSNLEQGLELGVLRLERLLDRERILELLRLTDPNRPAGPAAAAATAEEEKGDEVSEELIDELEERVEEAEERVRAEAAKLGAKMAGRLGDRAKREEGFRTEAVEARDDVLRLQNALRVKEDRLAQTVVDYLELRHAMLRVQQASSVAREDAAAERIVQEEEVQECRRSTAEQTKAVAEQVARTCEEVGGELRRQIQLREDEACMLQEQRAEAEELYEARAVRLEELLEEWKAKYSALRRKFALETEGFRRDADNIGRRFERIRAGPPGGRPSISSRGGSSAKHAVEYAMYSRPNMASAAPGRSAVREAGGGRGGRVARVGATAAAEAAYSSSSFGGRRRGGL